MTTQQNVFGRILLGLAVCLSVTCSGTTTQTLLDAEYLASGQTAISLISPLDQADTSQQPAFAWGDKTGIAKYVVEVSTTNDFASLVLAKEVSGGSYTLANSDLKGISQLDPLQYYWRVKAAKLQNNLLSKVQSFQVLETNTYYVNGSSTVTTQVGNKSAPFRTIQDAMSAANVSRSANSSSFVSIRVAAGTYTESVILKPGISLYGGYNASDWSRNTSTNTTTIQAALSAGVFASSDVSATFTATTIVDGFTIRGGAVSPSVAVYSSGSPTISNNILHGGSGNPSYGVQLVSSSSIISNNSIHPGTGSTTATGIEISGTSSATITNNTISGGAAATQYGINNSATSGTISASKNTITTSATGTSYGIANSASANTSYLNNTITANGGSPVYGIYINNSSPTISGNQILSATSSSYSAAVFAQNSSSAVVNNFLHGGAGTFNTRGVDCQGCSIALSNNTINGGTGSASANIFGVSVSLTSAITITNNVIFVSATSGSLRYCIYESDPMADPSSVHNNLVFDCGNGLYLDNSPNVVRNLESDLNTSANTTQGLPTSASGNLGPASVANFAAVNFVSSSDLRLTASSPLNVRCGGRNTSGSNCGPGNTAACGNVTSDFDSILRTASLTGTCVGASNAGAAGYSIGAYEKD